MKKISVTILLILLLISNGNAQITTSFKGKCEEADLEYWAVSIGFGSGRNTKCATISVSEVVVWDDFVDVIYEVNAVRNIQDFGMNIQNDCYISVGNTTLHLPICGQVKDGELYKEGSERIKMEKGQKGYYTLRYKGHIPSGATEISIKYGKGFGRFIFFNLFGLNNPKKYCTNLTSETLIKENIDNNNDGICGIYELIGYEKCSIKLACVKLNGEYQLIFMERKPSLSWLSMGDIKAWLTKTPSGIFKTKFLAEDETINESSFISFDGYSFTLNWSNDKPQNVYLKTYPIESQTGASDQIRISGSGTGFAIDKQGYFVTNHHVINGAGAIAICIQKDGEWVSYNGKVIKTDPTNDIAIIKIDDDDFKGFDNIPYSFSYESEDVAADIFTLGYPRVDVMGTDIKYTTGVINSRTGIQGDPTHYQISAHIDHGNSGGPLFNAKGQVIGITDSGLDKAEFGDVNYSVKSMYIKALVESLPVKLQLPSDTRISTMSRSQQIKTISPYVALILIAQ